MQSIMAQHRPQKVGYHWAGAQSLDEGIEHAAFIFLGDDGTCEHVTQFATLGHHACEGADFGVDLFDLVVRDSHIGEGLCVAARDCNDAHLFTSPSSSAYRVNM